MAKSNNDIRIAIVGAGMGGLTAALALAKRGFQNIDVYESASNLGFVGAGIQLAPNMGRSELYLFYSPIISQGYMLITWTVLERLGCWEDVYQEATVLQDTSIRSRISSPFL
jgi:salicylate hydroxylase